MRDTRLSSVDLMDSFHQFPRRCTFYYERAYSCCPRPLPFSIGIKGSQNNDACFREFCPNCDGRVDSAHIRKPKIHERDVGAVCTEQINGLLPIRTLRNQTHTGLSSQQRGDSVSELCMVVDGENPNRIHVL